MNRKFVFLLLFFIHFCTNLYPKAHFESESCGLLKDRIAGALLGAAIGDALGRITGFSSSRAEINKKFGPEGLTQFHKFMEVYHPVYNTYVVPYTDDMVMALELAKILIEGKQHNSSVNCMLHNLARTYAHLLGKSRYVVDPLFALRSHNVHNLKACARLEHLIDYGVAAKNPLWWQVGLNTDMAYSKEYKQESSCGSVTRAWPIGILFADNLALLKELADKQSCLTHRHPMARAASVALAVGISKALLQKSPEEVAQAMIDAAESFDEAELAYKKNAKKMPKECEFDQSMIVNDRLLTSDMLRYASYMAQQGIMPEKVLGVVNDKQSNLRSSRGALLGWAADEAVAAALYIFMRNPDDLKTALIEAVNTPGASDSIASLAGALVGARTGIQILHYDEFDYSKLENRISITTMANSIHNLLLTNLVKSGLCA